MTTAYNLPTGDFVTSTLNGALTAGATSGTIGSGLNLPATNGVLQIDYDSSIAVGLDNGPETVTYTSYTSGTGALAGLTRTVAGTTGVAHISTAKVQAAPSILYFNQDLATIIQQSAWTAWTPTIVGIGSPTISVARYQQLGKIIHCQLDVSGTGAGTTLTFSLPVSPKSTMRFTHRATNNGTSTLGEFDIVAANSTVSAYTSITSSAWTNATSWRIEANFTYEAN